MDYPKQALPEWKINFISEYSQASSWLKPQKDRKQWSIASQKTPRTPSDLPP